MTERRLWWVKEKKQMAFVFMIVTMMLQFQMKGCVGCLESERIGLLQLKSYLVNVLHVKEENILKSWSHGDNSSDCCVWERVKCDNSIGGHIVDLSLDEIIPANYSTLPRPLNLSLLHSFPQLKTFSFSENYFTHFFDPFHGYKSFQRLKKLRNLDLSYNSLDNRVLPFLNAARSLRNLTLEGNSRDGAFPLNGLTNLAELEVLNLMANRINLYDFRAGDGYNSFQRLKKLRTLDLSYNELNNSVLPFISVAKSLRTLSLCGNKLKGVLNLNGLINLRELEVLDLSDNGISDFEADNGYKSLQRLEMLSTLDLSSNLLNKSALLFLSAARSLRYLNLGANGLKGVFPPEELANMTKLRELVLDSNEFNLFSVKGLMNFRVLKVLDLRGNSINNFEAADGAMLPSSLQLLNLADNHLSFIPEGYSEICRLVYLRELDLRGNSLTSMPYCLGNITRLRTLELSGNQLNENLSSFVSGLPSALEYLSLLDNNFNGSFLFNSLANYTRLKVFRLSSNVGVIQPQAESSWVPLFQLKRLKLQNFILGSTIPGFLVHQHDLGVIDLSDNYLTGAFPTWLVQNNSRLQMLLLNSNSLTELHLPMRVHGLLVLDISCNRVHNSVQEDIGIIFPNLTYMNFSSNYFHGAIPSSMGEMKSLETLDMSSNGLSGQLPQTFLRGCYSLSYLELSNNQFHGNIFPEHANLTALEWLALDGNNFNGSLGKGLLKSKDLALLEISDNNISGGLPLWIGRMSSLGYLYMRGNQLKGPFPRQLQNLRLIGIDISHNSFSGYIPGNLGFSSLEELSLQSNQFTGSIPDTLFEAEKLVFLDLRTNNFSGMVLNSIDEKSSLRILLLRNNNLQSRIPEKICQVLSNVSILDLSHNKLKGVIPSCLGNMSFGGGRNNGSRSFGITSFASNIPTLQDWSYTSALNLDDDLRYSYLWTPNFKVEFSTKSRYEAYQGDVIRYMYGLDLSSNQLSGEIPVEIGNLQKIVSLNLSSNRLTGSIPYSISKLKDLESLDVSNNKLDGKIPPQLADLNSLGFFNVSYNNLSGEVPTNGHLLTFGEKSYIGNDHLCGGPTNKSCNPTIVPAAEEEEEGGDGIIDIVWFYWTCGAVYISTFLAVFVFLCIDTYWSREWFYRVDLFINHLQRFKRRFVGN